MPHIFTLPSHTLPTFSSLLTPSSHPRAGLKEEDQPMAAEEEGAGAVAAVAEVVDAPDAAAAAPAEAAAPAAGEGGEDGPRPMEI